MKKILIIDDSPTVLDILHDKFRKEGYEVIRAENGEDGIKKAKSEKPDLVIADTLLPGIDGYEVCRKLKESKDTAAIKVIVITGSIDAIDAVKAREMGSDDYVVKTSDYLHLIEAVKKLI